MQESPSREMTKEESARACEGFFTQLPVGMVVLRLDDAEDPGSLRIVEVNAAASTYVGLRPEDLTGRNLAEQFPNVRTTGVLECCAEVIREGTARDLGVIRYGDARVPEGAFRVYAFPLPNRCVGVCFENVNDRGPALRKLPWCETHVGCVLQDLDVGVAVVGARSKALLFNQAALELLGLTREQLARNFAFDSQWDAIREDGSPLGAQEHPAALAIATTRPVRNVVMGAFRPANGDRKWLLCSAVPHLTADGSVDEVVCSFSDFTSQMQAQAGLRESEERFRLLVEGVKDYAIILLDAEGHVVSWNPGAERITFYRAEEVLGKHFSMFYIPEEVQDDKPGRLLKVASAEGRAEDEGWRVRKDGSRTWANAVFTALRDEKGKLRGFSAVTRDMTERRRAEESMRQLSDRLLQLQDDERRRVARELHDGTAQSLAALALNLAILSESSKIAQDPGISNALSTCRVLVDRAFEEIRTISFLMHPPMLDEVGLPETLRWYIQGFVQRTKIEVDLDVPPELGKLPRELATALFRIVQECLANIHRHSESRTAEIRLVQDSGAITLHVRDYGKGLTAKANDRNFSVPANPGVGILGMHERVRLLGGKFEMTSVKPGTLVRATLPFVQKVP